MAQPIRKPAFGYPVVHQRVAGYGAAAAPPSLPRPPKRRSVGLVSCGLVVTLIVPPVVFLLTCWVFAFTPLNDRLAASRPLVAVAGALLVFVLGLARMKATPAAALVGEADGTSPWKALLFWTLLLSWIGGMALGAVISWKFMLPYARVAGMGSYASVDVSTTFGRQLLDAGTISFAEGTHLDLARAGAYRRGDVFCVAPVVPKSNLSLVTYDFWAIGTNCCGDATDGGVFTCAEGAGPDARSGLRFVQDGDSAALYRKALTQAQVTYKMSVQTPIFLEWVRDPVAMLSSYQNSAFNMFLFSALLVFGLQFFAALIKLASLNKDVLP